MYNQFLSSWPQLPSRNSFPKEFGVVLISTRATSHNTTILQCSLLLVIDFSFAAMIVHWRLLFSSCSVWVQLDHAAFREFIFTITHLQSEILTQSGKNQISHCGYLTLLEIKANNCVQNSVRVFYDSNYEESRTFYRSTKFSTAKLQLVMCKLSKNIFSSTWLPNTLEYYYQQKKERIRLYYHPLAVI